MGAMASQINSLVIVYSAVYSGADQRIHQSSASLAFVRGIHQWAVNSPHKGPVTRKMFPFDDVVMIQVMVCLSSPVLRKPLLPQPMLTNLIVLKKRQWPFNEKHYIFSCDQAAIWLVQSVRPSVRRYVCPSVCLSVCHTFFTMFPSSYHHEIFRSYYHGQKWCPCKRSRSEVKGQGHRGQHPT